MADGVVASGNGRVPVSWDKSAEALLKDWRQRSAAASEAHYKLASGLRKKNLWLGVPVVIFSSIVGTSLFATLANPNAVIPPAFKIAIGLISLAAAILAALQTFLRFGERAEKHVVAADWYAAVRRHRPAARPLGRGAGNAEELLRSHPQGDEQGRAAVAGDRQPAVEGHGEEVRRVRPGPGHRCSTTASAAIITPHRM